MSHRRLFVFMMLVICVALFPTLGHAQYRGSLRGTITDPQGLVIPGATVTLVNTDTNRTTVSTSDHGQASTGSAAGFDSVSISDASGRALCAQGAWI